MFSSTPTKTVAILGAGPSGLITASKLLSHPSFPFRLTIFDKSPHISGLWSHTSLINPQMQTNFCRFTGTFSDMSWDGVDLDGRAPPVYPKAWMVERYLQEYARRKVPEGSLELGVEVRNVERSGGRWRVDVVGRDGEGETRWFDYVVVATGYLSTPRELVCEMDAGLKSDPPIPILHSTQYRQLNQVIPPLSGSLPPKRHRILVIGGSHSGSEISTLIAQQASNARWRPGGNPTTSAQVEIIHIIHNRMFTVPSFCRDQTSESVSFHPLEFTLCERAAKGPAPISFEFSLADREQNQVLTAFYKHVVDGEILQEQVADELPLYAVMSDSYELFVQSGAIKPAMGVVKGLNIATSDTVSATIKSRHGNETTISDISAVINASGFDSCGSLSFLSEELKTQVEFDELCHRLPLILDTSWMSQHHSAPDIAFVGFVPVNWSIMEMQARAIAERWSGGSTPAHNEALTTHMRDLRDAIKDPKRRSQVPQFLFGDAMGIMEQAGRELNLATVNGETFEDYSGFVCAARWVGKDEDRTEAESTVAAIQRLQQRIWESDYLLLKVVFLSLLGKWTGRGEFGGASVEFFPRYPTAQEYDLEYVVVQTATRDGTSTKETLIARYSEAVDEISLWDVDGADGLSARKLIVALRCGKNESGAVHTVASNGADNAPFLDDIDFKGSRLRGFRMAGSMYNAPGHAIMFERSVANAAPEELADSSLFLTAFESLDDIMAEKLSQPLAHV